MRQETYSQRVNLSANGRRKHLRSDREPCQPLCVSPSYINTRYLFPHVVVWLFRQAIVHVHIMDTMKQSLLWFMDISSWESSENVLVKSRRSVVDYDFGAFIGPSSATAATHLPRSHSDTLNRRLSSLNISSWNRSTDLLLWRVTATCALTWMHDDWRLTLRTSVLFDFVPQVL